MRRRRIAPNPIFDTRRVHPHRRWIRFQRTALSLLAAFPLITMEATAARSTGVDFGELLAGTREPSSITGTDWIRGPGSEVSPLTPGERALIERQREEIRAIARKKLGRSLRGNVSDLELLQRLVDEGAVGAHRLRDLQAMGVVLGQLLVDAFAYRWVAYEDERGRTRAVRDPATGRVFFPVTAISRRVEVGAPVDVAEIYLSIAPSYARRPGSVSVRGPVGASEERTR